MVPVVPSKDTSACSEDLYQLCTINIKEKDYFWVVSNSRTRQVQSRSCCCMMTAKRKLCVFCLSTGSGCLLQTRRRSHHPSSVKGTTVAESSEVFCSIYLITIFKQSFSIFCTYLSVLIWKRRIPLETALQLLSPRNHLLGGWWQEAPIHAVQAVGDKHDTDPSQDLMLPCQAPQGTAKLPPRKLGNPPHCPWLPSPLSSPPSPHSGLPRPFRSLWCHLP